MGPLLNADQFAKFMKVIKSLGARVELEHSAQLAELRRLEQSSNSTSGISSHNGRNMNSGSGGEGGGMDSAIDFESLVRGGVGATKKAVPQDMWDDDSLAGSGTLTPITYSTPSISPAFSPSSPQNFNSRPLPSSNQRTNSNSNMGARTISPSSYNSTAFSSPVLPPPPPFSSPPISLYSSFPSVASPPPPQATSSLNSFVALQPSSRSVTPSSKPPQHQQQSGYNSNANASYGSGKSNYNISLPSQVPSPSTYTSQLPSLQPSSQYGMQPLQPTTSAGGGGKNSNGWNIVPPVPSPSFGVLVPTVIDRKVNKVTPSFGDWADLDPLK